MAAVNDSNRREAPTGGLPSIFAQGYFTERLLKGDKPNYGYPVNHLPEPTVEEMEVETCFIAALNKAK